MIVGFLGLSSIRIVRMIILMKMSPGINSEAEAVAQRQRRVAPFEVFSVAVLASRAELGL